MYNSRKNNIYNFIFLFLCAIALISCGEDRQKGVSGSSPIRFAFQNRIGSAIPIIAAEKGFFADHGLKISPQRFNNGPACAEALYSGSADIGTMGDTTAIISVTKTDGLTIIASHSAGEHRHRLIVKQEASYQSLADLRGKRVGIKKGTSTYGGLLAALKASQISHEELEIIDLSPGTMPNALAAGAIDAFAASEPSPSLAELQGGRELMTFGGLGNNYPIMILAQRDFLHERQNDVVRFLRALYAAEKFISDYPDQTAEILAKTTGLPLDVARQSMTLHDYKLRLDGIVIASLENSADFLKSEDLIENTPDFSAVSSMLYLNLAQKNDGLVDTNEK